MKVENMYEEIKHEVEHFIQNFIKKFGNVKVKAVDNKIIISTKLPKPVRSAIIRIKYFEEKVRTVIDVWDCRIEGTFTFHIDMEEKILITTKNTRKTSTDYDHKSNCTVIYITTSITKIKVTIDLNAFEHMQPFIYISFM